MQAWDLCFISSLDYVLILGLNVCNIVIVVFFLLGCLICLVGGKKTFVKMKNHVI